MNSSSFPISPRAVLVADASVVINLNATARAADIIRALPNRLVTTDNAFIELTNGACDGHDDARQLQVLIEQGLVQVVSLSDAGSGIYEALIEGTALRTLDDGEAATIGYAHEAGAIALIDERKARGLCAERFPRLRVASTVDVLMHEWVVAALGQDGQIDAIVRALQIARMRVPPEQLAKVVNLIGSQHAAFCESLPRAAREVS
jgi:predicted nucleic acid-binding protein